jgi:HAD superfamily hydrolase (TIGR01450 family)
MKSDIENAYSQLKRIQDFILDLDGTLYLGEKIFSWSLPFLQKVERSGRRVCFVTNNSSQRRHSYVAKLKKMGVRIEERQLLTSGGATIDYLRRYVPGGSDIFLLGTPDLAEEFRDAGFRLTDRQPAAVVLGMDLTLTYDKLCTACQLIDSGVPFFATHPDTVCPTPWGSVPDCGALTAAITAATGIKPRILGKPNPQLLETLGEQFGLQRENSAIVGDRLDTDIALGRGAGIYTILVLSGQTKVKDLAAQAEAADLVAENLGEVTRWLEVADTF